MFYLNIDNRNEIIINKFMQQMNKKSDMFKYTDKDVYKDNFLSGQLLAWLSGNTLIIGKPFTTDTGIKAVELNTAKLEDDAEHEEFDVCLHHIEQELKLNGFNEIRFSGRSGWNKIYPSFKPLHVTYVKEI